MKKRLLLLSLALLACLALSAPVWAAGAELGVNKNGVVTAEASAGNQLFIASYDPATGRFLGLVKSGGTVRRGVTALKAIETDASFAPQKAAKTVLVVSTANGTAKGGSYDGVAITADASGTVTLENISVTGKITVYGGSALVLKNCSVPAVTANTDLAIMTSGTTTVPDIFTDLASEPSVSVNGVAASVSVPDGVRRATLAVNASNIQVKWPAKEGYNGDYYYSLNGGTPQKAYSWSDPYSGTEAFNVNNLVSTANPGSLSFAILLGADGETWAEGTNLITFTASGVTPNVSIRGQEDGTYAISSPAGYSMFRYILKSPDGGNIYSSQTTSGSINYVAPYTGCTFEVKGLNWTQTGNDLASLAVSISNTQIGVGFVPYDFSSLEATVTSEAEFNTAMNKGGTVRLGGDVKITNCSIERGGDVTLNLNGFTLDIGNQNTLSVTNGKGVRIIDSSEGKTGRVAGSAGISGGSGAALICEGCTLERVYFGRSSGVSGRELRLSEATICNLSVYNISNVVISGGTYGSIGENGSGLTFFQTTATVSGAVIHKGLRLYQQSNISVENASVRDSITVDNSTLTLNGTEVTLDEGTTWFNLLVQNGGSLTTDSDLSDYIGKHIVNTPNGDGTWTITQA